MARLLRTTSIVDPAPIGLVALWGATSSKPWRSGDGRRVSPCSVRRASVLPYTVASMAVQCVELDVEDAVGEMDLKDGVEGQRRPIRPFPFTLNVTGPAPAPRTSPVQTLRGKSRSTRSLLRASSA
jgi:hypothetical protein